MVEKRRSSSRTKGKEEKEAVEGISSHATGRGDSGKSPKKENFQGACTELTSHVFEAGANRSAQISTYNTSMEAIKNYVGINYDPHVLQSI